MYFSDHINFANLYKIKTMNKIFSNTHPTSHPLNCGRYIDVQKKLHSLKHIFCHIDIIQSKLNTKVLIKINQKIIYLHMSLHDEYDPRKYRKLSNRTSDKRPSDLSSSVNNRVKWAGINSPYARLGTGNRDLWLVNLKLTKLLLFKFLGQFLILLYKKNILVRLTKTISKTIT